MMQVIFHWDARPGAGGGDESEEEVASPSLGSMRTQLVEPPQLESDKEGPGRKVGDLYRLASSTAMDAAPPAVLPSKSRGGGGGEKLWAWAGGSHTFAGSQRPVQAMSNKLHSMIV